MAAEAAEVENVLVVEAAAAATIIRGTRVSPGSPAGSGIAERNRRLTRQPLRQNLPLETAMPGRGRSSFTKRQKEHTRQQKQRDKAERRSQRKTDDTSAAVSDSSELDWDELQRHAAEQAALFQMGADDADISSIPRERAPETTEP